MATAFIPAIIACARQHDISAEVAIAGATVRTFNVGKRSLIKSAGAFTAFIMNAVIITAGGAGTFQSAAGAFAGAVRIFGRIAMAFEIFCAFIIRANVSVRR